MLRALKEVYYSSSYKYIWYASLTIRGIDLLFVLAGIQKIIALPPQLFNADTALLMCIVFLIALLAPHPGLKEEALYRTLRRLVISTAITFVIILLIYFFAPRFFS